MGEGNLDRDIGKLLANQERMESDIAEIKELLKKHEETFTLLRGQKTGIMWLGSAVIAAATATGLTVTKLIGLVIPPHP